MSRPEHQWSGANGIKHMKIEETDDKGNISSQLFSSPIIDVNEAERLIENLKRFDIKDVGNKEWMAQHRVLEKLNLQAHHNAMSNSDEFILEGFLTFAKLPVLIHDLLLIEAWKENIYPLIKEKLADKNSMRLYFILYHEATIVNLFEVFFYYKHCIEAMGESLLDLVDYVARKLQRLNNPHYKFREFDLKFRQANTNAKDPSEAAKQFAADLEARTRIEELDEHWKEIEFRVCISSVALGRFLVEHADVLPLTVLTRIVDTHDYLILIIPLIENPPWTRRSNNKWQKVVDHKWTDIEPINLLKVTKIEGQPWIALYHLVAKKEFQERYYLNSFRKGQLLRIRKYLNELLLDQLPFLADVQRYMDELAVTNVPEPNSLNNTVFMFQPVALMTEAILKGKNVQEIADYQIENVFTMDDRSDTDLLELADLYSDEAIENIY